MDFEENLVYNEFRMSPNPFGNRTEDGEWIETFISVDYLNKHFKQFDTATEMKEATSSIGLKKYFDWLVEKGKLEE